ncbi:hypothetical protein ACJRO7_000625 [Eucalyptus globulus]|uniref:Pentatricopeptide repeat-containing protein n=1 Tax=Eucalyptus globulus TaxID=34317 RepID=A0ABD3LN79_EUCGL
MKPTKFCSASSIFLLLHAPAAISSESSSHSILHLPHPSHLPFSSPRRRRFSSTPYPNLDVPIQVLSYLRTNRRAGGGGVFTSVGDALCCFGKMIKASPLPSSRDFSLLLGAIVRMKHYSTAIRLIEQLPSLGVEGDVALLNILINCFCRLKRVDMGFSILGRIFKLGFHITVVTRNTLIDGLFIQGKTDQALRFLDDMGRNGPEPDETTYNRQGAMQGGCRINSFTYNIVIDGLCKEGLITEALRLHESMSKKGIKPDVVTYTSLIHGLCNVGQMEDALILLEEMTSGGIQPDIFTYNSLVHCLCSRGQWKDAMVLLEKMMEAGIEPDAVTYTSVIQGVCNSGQLKEAQRLLSHMVQCRVMPNVQTFSILVDAHCKEGLLVEAEALVDRMIQLGKMPNSFIYSALMIGYCLQNRMKDAMAVLNLMVERGCSPNVVSYNTLINGYCKAKRVDKSKMLFQEMLQRGLNPDVITYYTRVNGFCQVGNLETAEELINEMQRESQSLSRSLYLQFFPGWFM